MKCMYVRIYSVCVCVCVCVVYAHVCVSESINCEHRKNLQFAIKTVLWYVG